MSQKRSDRRLKELQKLSAHILWRRYRPSVTQVLNNESFSDGIMSALHWNSVRICTSLRFPLNLLLTSLRREIGGKTQNAWKIFRMKMILINNSQFYVIEDSLESNTILEYHTFLKHEFEKSNTLRKDGLGPYEGRPDRASRQCFDDRPTIATCDRAAEADIALDNISDTCCTMVTIAHRCQRRNIKVSVSCWHPST